MEDKAALYAAAHSLQPTEVQRELIAETAALGRVAAIQIGPLQGAFMTVLATALRPRLAVEVGTFNEHVAADERASAVLLPIGDGLTMISRGQ